MRDETRNIIARLIDGHSIKEDRRFTGTDCYVLIDKNKNRVLFISAKKFRSFERYLRKQKDRSYVADKKFIRSLHGNSAVKQLYKKMLKI